MTKVLKSRGSKTSPSLPSHWTKEESYTSDDVITAYMKGKKDGMEDYKKILLEKLSSNMSTATKLTESFCSEITSEYKVEFKKAYLRIADITKFEVLIPVPETKFVSNDFRKIYLLADKVKQVNNNETFYITFSFMPISEQFNEQALINDGFAMQYERH